MFLDELVELEVVLDYDEPELFEIEEIEQIEHRDKYDETELVEIYFNY